MDMRTEGKKTGVFTLSGYLIIMLLVLSGIGGTFCAAFAAQNVHLLPDEGGFPAYIVIPEHATEIERYAAEELRSYIGRITGAGISVVKERSNLLYFGFYIGMTERGGRYAPKRVLPYEGSNGFRLKSIPAGIAIAGGDDLSTLYGVYSFLEEYQGCAWLLPIESGEIVPENESIIVPENIDVTEIPDIPIRWIGDGDWALKNRMNVKIEVNGHQVGAINQWSYHTFGVIMPKKKYYDAHPEYYSLIESEDFEQFGWEKKVKGDTRYCTEEMRRWQLCTSNPELVKKAAHILIETLKRNPDVQFIYLTPNDGAGYCQCSHCRGQVEAERKEDPFGHETGPIFAFSNKVAGRVKKYCPDSFIKIGAYHVYTRYPLDPAFRLEDNLAVQVCHYDFCFNHAIDDAGCPYNVDFMKDFTRWSATKRVHIYAYSCLHGWANLIWPMAHSLARDMPEYHRRGVELYYTQSGYLSPCYGLNYFVASKLAWNSSQNVADLIEKYCAKSYGAAGEAMARYHEFIEKSWAESGLHVSYAVEPVPVSLLRFFPSAMIARADELLSEAESSKVDPGSRKRLEFARVELDYLKLTVNYLNAISEPFGAIDAADKNAVERATEEAQAIGNVLGPAIEAYYREHYPEILHKGWSMTGVEGLAGTHNRPNRIPGLLNKQ